MARLSRVVVPGFPHHVTQRGNRRADVFLDAQDRGVFLRLLRTKLDRYSVENLGYCLMRNHVHLIPVPQEAEALSSALRDILGSYATYFNQKHGLNGRLWQGRFYSCVLDDPTFGRPFDT